MNKPITTILLFFCISAINAQNNQFKKVSIEPVLKKCVKSKRIVKEGLVCTYDKIYLEVRNLINSHDNSKYARLKSFKLDVTWNKKGAIKKTVLYNEGKKIKDELSESINQYFKSLDFYPAKSISGKTVKYKMTQFIKMEDNQVRLDSIVNPMFPGCNNALLSPSSMKNCSNISLLEHVFSKLKYPAEARNNKTDGTAIIRFIVNTDGFIEDLTIEQDPGDGCGQTALEIFQKMKESGIRWIPGKINGVNSPLPYITPVKFKLVGR